MQIRCPFVISALAADDTFCHSNRLFVNHPIIFKSRVHSPFHRRKRLWDTFLLYRNAPALASAVQ
jgi:hypothetical protein